MLIIFFIRNLVELYLSICISVVLHELMHMTVAYVCGYDCINICLGIDGFLGVRINKLFISPCILSGYVIVKEKKGKEYSYLKWFIFYFAGIFANILLLLYGIINMYLFLIITNSIFILTSLLPFEKCKSDVSNFCKEVNRIRRERIARKN